MRHDAVFGKLIAVFHTRRCDDASGEPVFCSRIKICATAYPFFTIRVKFYHAVWVELYVRYVVELN